MLEEMGAFFDSRLDCYDDHQRSAIAQAGEFYPFTARLLPTWAGCRVLDLGCGTGLELEEYFSINPTARVTGIDLAPGMLSALARKFPERDLELILGSYFEVPFGEGAFDAAVSVESLHHFTFDEKVGLYRRVLAALKTGGSFVLTDYVAGDAGEELALRREYLRLREAERAVDGVFYHFDTPLTVEHEADALRRAGFSRVEVLRRWSSTATIRAAG